MQKDGGEVLAMKKMNMCKKKVEVITMVMMKMNIVLKIVMLAMNVMNMVLSTLPSH